MTDDDEPDDPNDLSLFAEQFSEVAQFGQSIFRANNDQPVGPIRLDGGTLDIGCGCGGYWSGENAAQEFNDHECPLRGVELSAEDMFGMVNDPGGRRRAHMAELANVVESGEIAVQSVFPTGDGDGPHFAYTIGATGQFGGEFMVRGFGDACCQIVDAGILWLRDGVMRLEPGVYRIGDESAAVVRVDRWRGDPADFGMAVRYFGHEDFGMFHLVMADDEGRFPEDPDCECAEYQMMGLP